MTNDDQMYLRHLEQALEAAELEIKGLEGELREQDKILAQMQEQLSPTHMGEPYIDDLTAEQAFNIMWPNQDIAPCEPCEAFAAGFNFRRRKQKVGAADTATLHQKIRSAQIAAGEDAVIANLRSMGLLPNG